MATLSRPGARAATAGLVLLAGADLVLSTVAVRAGAAEPTGAPAPAASSRTIEEPGPSTASATTAALDPAAGDAARVVVVGVDARHAWRFSRGSCSGVRSTLERTSDGGSTWQATSSPFATITRLKSTDAVSAFAVGANRSCKPRLRSTGDAGTSWGSSGSVAQTWYVDPKDPSAVGAPGAGTSHPCADGARVVDLAVIDAGSARALCADGSVHDTSSAGSSWERTGRLKGALAMAVPADQPGQTYVARAGGKDCAGVEVVRLGASAASASCAAPKGGAVDLPSAGVSLSLTSDGAWLAVGRRVLRSADLTTWD